MIMTKSGFKAEQKGVISEEEIREFTESETKKYKVSTIVKTEVKLPLETEIIIGGNKITIEVEKDKINLGKNIYKITGHISDNWHSEAENFLENFINDYFSLFGSHIEIKYPFSVHYMIEDKWYFQSSAMVSGTAIRVVKNKEECDVLDLTKSLNRIRKSKIPNNNLDKLEKIFSLLKRATLLKKDYVKESFLCFYKVVEMISEDIKKVKYDKLYYTSDVVEMEDLGVMTELRSQKLKLYVLLKLLDIHSIDTAFKYKLDRKNIIALADIRNKFSHTDVNISQENIEGIHSLSLLSMKKYIKIVNYQYE